MRRRGRPGLGGLGSERILAIGESQSAFALTTYVDAVQPLARPYDGFLLHSRVAASLPLAEPGRRRHVGWLIATPVQIRTDLDVPVMMLETENDLTSVIDYYAARQDDTDRIRPWEMAGTAHADRTIMGRSPTPPLWSADQRRAPALRRARAAPCARHLGPHRRGAAVAPAGDHHRVGSPAIVRDADGNALGGMRLAQIEVPVATLSGEKGPTGGGDLHALGTTVPFTSEQLAQLYPRPRPTSTRTRRPPTRPSPPASPSRDREEILAEADAAISG